MPLFFPICYTCVVSQSLENFLSKDIRSLLADGDSLLSLFTNPTAQVPVPSDYSFLVFPYAKAYEGFLKLLFLRYGIITNKEFESDRFRIGKALNPHLEKRMRRLHSAYDRFVNYCDNGTELADRLWQTWKQGRNLLFHFFPKHYKTVSITQAQDTVAEILMTMEVSLENCTVKYQPRENNNRVYNPPPTLGFTIKPPEPF